MLIDEDIEWIKSLGAGLEKKMCFNLDQSVRCCKIDSISAGLYISEWNKLTPVKICRIYIVVDPRDSELLELSRMWANLSDMGWLINGQSNNLECEPNLLELLELLKFDTLDSPDVVEYHSRYNELLNNRSNRHLGNTCLKDSCSERS